MASRRFGRSAPRTRAMARKKKEDPEFHVLSKSKEHGALLEECKTEGEHEVENKTTLHHMRPVKQGTNLDAVGPIYNLVPGKRKGHVRMKEIKTGKGPAKVSTPRYRDGWDRTFGAGGMSN